MSRGRSPRICSVVLPGSQKKTASATVDVDPEQTEKLAVMMMNGNINIAQGLLRVRQTSQHDNNAVPLLNLLRITVRLKATIKAIHYSTSKSLVAGLKVLHLTGNPTMHLFRAIARHQNKMVHSRQDLRNGQGRERTHRIGTTGLQGGMRRDNGRQGLEHERLGRGNLRHSHGI